MQPKTSGISLLLSSSCGPMDSLAYTRHAQRIMTERRITDEWVERTVATPALRARDPYDDTVERFYLGIAERGGRMLQVAVNTESEPWRVVSTFFDRSVRGDL